MNTALKLEQTVDPVDHTKLAKVKQTWAEALGQLTALPCETVEHEQWWGTRLSMVQEAVAELEAERQILVRPLIDDKTRIDKLFKDAAKAPEAVKDLIKGKLATAAEARLAAENVTRETARLAAQSGDTEGCQAALAELSDAVQIAGASTGFVWEIADIDSSVLPKEYWVIDYAKLEAIATEARKSEQAPVVPGVTFKRSARISARRGKK